MATANLKRKPRRVRLSKFASSIKGRPKRLLILKTKENTDLFPARCSYEYELALVVRALFARCPYAARALFVSRKFFVLRTSSAASSCSCALFVRCSYEVHHAPRARTHPRTTRRSRLRIPLPRTQVQCQLQVVPKAEGSEVCFLFLYFGSSAVYGGGVHAARRFARFGHTVYGSTQPHKGQGHTRTPRPPPQIN